jgi:hypothetical protein
MRIRAFLVPGILLAAGCGKSGGGGASPTPTPASCTALCLSAGTALCDDTVGAYAAGTCPSYCASSAGWAVGTVDTSGGNSIACRQHYAQLVEQGTTSRAAGCPNAGPSGNDVCGTWCDNYCQLALRNCTGPNELYADVPSCMAACSGLASTGQPGDQTGDSVQCRIYHLGIAATDPATFCAHGAAVSPTCQ